MFNSADGKSVIVVPENRIWHFMQIVSIAEKKYEKNISICRPLKILLRVLSINMNISICRLLKTYSEF